jgi:hypothetical protein
MELSDHIPKMEETTMTRKALANFNSSQLTLLAIILTAFLLSSCSFEKAAEMATPTGEVLFQDDFSDPNSGWLQGEDDIGLVKYSDGGLFFHINGETSAKISIPRLHFTDTSIETTAKKIAGTDDNEFGIVCRYKDQDNFYFFTISSDGYYGIGKYKNNTLYLIGMDKMKTSDFIRQGEQENYLRLDCVGSTLTFYVNGQKIGQVIDNDFSFGDVGLLAGTFRSTNTDIVFGSFSVKKP